MNKIEKLKEVNDMLRKMCISLETRIFIENMDVNDDKSKEVLVEDKIANKTIYIKEI